MIKSSTYILNEGTAFCISFILTFINLTVIALIVALIEIKKMGGEEMKKYVGFTLIALLISLTGAMLVQAGYNLGPNNIFHMEASNGTDLRGTWAQGLMSNGTKEAYNYEKQVYARAGSSGTYSDWAPKSQNELKHRDYGSLFDDYYEVSGDWRPR